VAAPAPGHFEVRKSSSQVRSPRVPDAAKGSPDPVALQIVICCSHYYRSKAIGRAGSQGGGSSSQVILPGAPWCRAATVYAPVDQFAQRVLDACVLGTGCMVTRVRISSQTFVFIAMLLRYAAFGMGCTLLQCLGQR